MTLRDVMNQRVRAVLIRWLAGSSTVVLNATMIEGTLIIPADRWALVVNNTLHRSRRAAALTKETP